MRVQALVMGAQVPPLSVAPHCSSPPKSQNASAPHCTPPRVPQRRTTGAGVSPPLSALSLEGVASEGKGTVAFFESLEHATSDARAASEKTLITLVWHGFPV